MLTTSAQHVCMRRSLCHNANCIGQRSKVYFFCKQHPPSDTAEKLTLAKNLANIGTSLPKYIEAFETQDVESDRHKEEYTNRRNSTPQSSSTQRKRQRMELDKELQ
ncbi:uncharacterized protein LOC122963640 isoform X1 [Acropora millepora]|uniref:uncharacterized protein LOC122963640 isoform X1 n=1 Tax=Acropora millepora TaxID=45264 RepID=UPI001CF4FD77|nr:uncharacterized protein LOC122963640 isoform X1 [Acropora millepora]